MNKHQPGGTGLSDENGIRPLTSKRLDLLDIIPEEMDAVESQYDELSLKQKWTEEGEGTVEYYRRLRDVTVALHPVIERVRQRLNA